MDNIKTALDNINIALEKLNSVKLILESESDVETVVTKHGADYNVEHVEKVVPVQPNRPKVNTYRIERLCTTGWSGFEPPLSNLTKEDASAKIKNLVDREEVNPSDLRVVVDGQV